MLISFAVCRLPFAVCRYYNKILSLQHVIVLVLLIFSVSSETKASLSDCYYPNNPQPILTLVTPMEFDTMPVGSIVSERFSFKLNINCNVGVGSTVGFRMDAVPGLKIVTGVALHNYMSNFYESTIYSTPELEARGLGFVNSIAGINVSASVFCFSGSGSNSYISGFPRREQPALVNQSAEWLEVPALNCYGDTVYRFYLGLKMEANIVKIGNSSESTMLPQNFTTSLFGYSLLNQGNLIPVSSIEMLWNIGDFSSRVLTRTCTTPTASQSIIYLGNFSTAEIGAMTRGTEKPPHEFNFTFDCPRAGYQAVSFFVEMVYPPSYGGFSGVMGIANGDGMAKGVGIRLQIKQFNQWRNVIFIKKENELLNYDYGRYVLYRLAPNNYIDPLIETALHPHVISFRASLIRLNESVSAGQIKAAALIHIRYN